MIRRIGAIGLLFMAACDDPEAAPDAGDLADCRIATSDRYLPLAIGTTWSYDVTDLVEKGAPTVLKSSTVEALEDVGDRKEGTTAFRIRTEKVDGTTVSWQEDRCTSVVRHREESFDETGALVSDQFFVPLKLRVDETEDHLVVGATWSLSYTEVEVDPVAGTRTVSKDETWTVEGIGEDVDVPAGTFTTIHLRKVTSGDADKQFWFAPGVGKVKEEGEQLEQLRAYTQP